MVLSLTHIKNFSIQTGLYNPARWLSRRLRPSELRAHLADIRFYKSLFPTSALCFDVGANIGAKSEAMLRAGGRVVAFEPSPVAQLELRARCSREKDWTLVPAAVGAECGIAVLHAACEAAKSSLAQGWHVDIVSTYHVPVVTLDAAIKNFGKPFFCKIDVEGWELEVLRGLSQPIPLISFEFHLSERDIAKTVSRLKRSLAFGSHYEWFPGDLKNTLPRYSYGEYLYGNIFVKQTRDAPSC